MRLRIRRLDPAIALPCSATGSAAGCGLAAASHVEVPFPAARLIGAGLLVALPNGLPASRVRWDEVDEIPAPTRGGD